MKTWLVAVFCVIRCILYPGTKICIASQNRNQANEVLEKITTDLMIKSANLRMEISDYSVGQNKAFIEFKNGSWIKVVTAKDSGRSARANILITDEFRMVPLNIINTVLRKFLTASRDPKFLNKPEYKHLAERNKELYMSSAWFKSHWSYEKAQAYCANLLNDKRKYFICGLPYQMSIKENLLSREQVEDEMSEQDFNQMSWDIEMGCLFYGDTDGAFFSYEDISKRRVVHNPMYPLSKKHKIPDLSEGEKRILSVDIALMASKRHNNDASAIIINSALPASNNSYISNIVYMENHEGLTTDELGIIVMRLFYQYKCTDIAVDTAGVGLGVFDFIIKDQTDPETGEIHKALSCINDPDMAARCKIKDAPKVIWSIKAGAKFNTEMSLLLRGGFQNGKINLLISEFEADEVLREKYPSFNKMSSRDQTNLKLPYIQTTLMINELVNLDHKASGNEIKITEKSGARKDRYSSLGYNYWVANQIEVKRKPKNKTFDPSAMLKMRSPVLRRR